MPVTNGHGNPDWTREETLFALELLYREGKPLGEGHEAVAALSDFLRRAAIHPPETRRQSFRNPAGVALKLQNLFSAVEPGRGLTHSYTDRAVVKDFPKAALPQLRQVVDALRTLLNAGEMLQFVENEEEEFSEGQWLTGRHRRRDARLRLRLLERHKDKQLICEMCDFSPSSLERPMQESQFEAHHRIPLAAAETARSTKVSDMALLCACCHRLLHRLISTERRWVTPEEARRLQQIPRVA
ncbi:HNH endonuclease [Rhizobium hidalgonense]|uniref:HNH endonuclease n=1 Tax=Rhizobium hidalgonense TaxID=1538159 RepID=A0AAJ2GW54_9HYPH|nr:HNH endonuclease [Rhizobium hidalgonense]MDR9774324.1 HNH endonuclease [Rhizobium hidalgonense]